MSVFNTFFFPPPGLPLICVLYQELLTKISFGENPDRLIEKHRQKIFNWTKRQLSVNVKV